MAKLIRTGIILALFFVSYCLGFMAWAGGAQRAPAGGAHGKEGLSGGGDPDVTEALLIAHRLLQWQRKQTTLIAFDASTFAEHLENIENSLHPLYPGPARLRFTDKPVADDNDVEKKARFDLNPEAGKESIEINSSKWNHMLEPKKYTLIGTEFIGLDGGDRYINSMLLLEHASEIAEEKIDIMSVLHVVMPDKTIENLKTYSFSTSEVGNTISWTKNLLRQGLYRGHSPEGAPCRVLVHYFPVEGGLEANGVDVEISGAQSSEHYTVLDDPRMVLPGFQTTISKSHLSTRFRAAHGLETFKTWIPIPQICWVDHGVGQMDLNESDAGVVSVHIKNYVKNCVSESANDLTCTFDPAHDRVSRPGLEH